MAYSDKKKPTLSARLLSAWVLVALTMSMVSPAALVFADESTESTTEASSETTGTEGTEGVDGGDATAGGTGESTTEEEDTADAGDAGVDGTMGTTTPEGEGVDGDDQPEGVEGTEGSEGTDLSTTTPIAEGNGIPAVVDTGNATSTVELVNTGNVGTTNASSTTGGTTTTDVLTVNTISGTSTATASAQTGYNEAADPDGAYIFTGASDAFGMIVSMFNIVVTNSFGSLLYLQNPLGPALDLTSSITSAFAQTTATHTPSCTLTGCESSAHAIFNAVTDSVAEITNTLVVRSGSGGNEAVSTEEAVVETGDARAFGSIINFGNLQIINSRYLVILMNNFGDLEGDIVLPTADFFETLSTTAAVKASSETEVTTANEAEVTTQGDVSGSSGDNTTFSTESALIDTGDATAGADIHNFVNQTALGGKPICFIVSAGKGWQGTVVGLPPGFSREKTTFGELICGAGGAEARALDADQFTASTTNYAKILNRAIVAAATGNNMASGTDAYIKTGDADAFLSVLNLVNQNIIGQDWIFALFTISGEWKGDLTFGSDEFWHEVQGEVDEYVARSSGSGGGALRRQSADLSVEKTVNKAKTTASSSVEYTVIIKNDGGPVYNSLLIDTIYNEAGKPIHEQRWGLDTIQEDETITISYTVFFAASTTPGTYYNEAFISGAERHPDIETNLGKLVNSPIATAEIEIEGSVLGLYIDEEAVCMPYLTKYLRLGLVNDSGEVLKLQKFLSDFEGMDVPLTGVFDSATDQAVKAFQEKYKNEVLTPWGMQGATGFVYYTTQKKVNELYCRGTQVFALSPVQSAEIESYKKLFTAVPRTKDDETKPAATPMGGTFEDVDIDTKATPTSDTGMNGMYNMGTHTATTVERVIERVRASMQSVFQILSESIYKAKKAFASEA